MERLPAPADPLKVHPPNGFLSAWILGQFPPGYSGWAIDVGASDGVSVNTTYLLEKAHGWNVLSVEPNPIFWPRLKALRRWTAGVACDAVAAERQPFYSFDHNPEAYSALRPTFPPDFPLERGDRRPSGWTTLEVPVRTLDQLLRQWEFPALDCLCVDTEGTELEVLKGCDLKRWQPKVMVIESWDESGGAVRRYVEALGYRHHDRNVHNDLYLFREE